MPKLAASLIAALAFAMSSCSEYLDRRDTLLLGAGEAVQTNIVTHAADPWPRVAQRRELTFSGERMVKAVKRVERDEPAESATQGARNGPGPAPAQLGSGASPSPR